MVSPKALNRQNLEKQVKGVVQDLRRLSAEHVEIGRRLALMAHRIECGEVDQFTPIQILGEPAERIVAAIISGKLDDLG